MENKYIINGRPLDIYPPAESGLECLLRLSRGQLFTDSETLEKWGVQYRHSGEKIFELYLFDKGEGLTYARELFNQLKEEIENPGSTLVNETSKEQSRSYPSENPSLFLKPVTIEGKQKWEVSYDTPLSGKAHIITNSYRKANEIFSNYIRKLTKSSANVQDLVEKATKPKTFIETAPNGVVIETTEE